MTAQGTPKARQRKTKERADVVLVQQGLAESRAKAQALILAGQVLHETERIDKPGTLLPSDASLTLKGQERYVSRGGKKLEAALTDLAIDPSGLVCLDVGASTGGFTDCLLQHGAAKVYAVDVGQGLLAHRLTTDPRVVVRDKTNARFLKAGDFEEPIRLTVVDASFIGVSKLATALYETAADGARVVVMVKPQFEVGREIASRTKGVIRDPEIRGAALKAAAASLRDVGFEYLAGVDSAVSGPKGNVEHFLLLRKRASGTPLSA